MGGFWRRSLLLAVASAALLAACSDSRSSPAPAAPALEASRSRYVLDGDFFSTRFASTTRRTAGVLLPARANGPIQLRDQQSDVSVEVSLVEASAVDGTPDAERVVFPRALSGADVWHRALPEGFEDFIAFERAPARPEARYAIALGRRVAGLRLVESVLELLDAGGVPRLRMNPPYLIANGRRIRADVAVRGCHVVTDPRPPFNRSVEAPGADRCEVTVSWDEKALSYPALLDPVWTTTGNMIEAREGHVAARLGADVLVAGGSRFDPTTSTYTELKSAEIYATANGVWTATTAMSVARAEHRAVELPTTGVLVVGGLSTDSAGTETYHPTSELYAAATGSWSPANQKSPRASPALVWLQGQVMAAGGTNAGAILQSVEFYSPVTNTWTWAVPMYFPRMFPRAVTLIDDTVLVEGGIDPNEPNPYAERYYPASGTWKNAGGVGFGAGATLTRLGDGRVLLVLGIAAKVYDPASDVWTQLPYISPFRTFHTATLLANGRVLFAGGSSSFGGLPTSSARMYVADGGIGSWAVIDPMLSTRANHTATPLGDGSVLLAGGQSDSFTTTAKSELFRHQTSGTPCSLAANCESGFCVDGVCCDSLCPGKCKACSKAKNGQQDGSCLPIVAGSDPDIECATDPLQTCGQTGECDGYGQCQTYPLGTLCGSVTCAGGDKTEFRCKTEGCKSTVVSCGPYVCASATQCATSCTSDTQCAANAWCRSSDETCQLDQPNGASCTSATACQSGYCVEGVCCNEACSGGCRSCLAANKPSGADGICGFVKDGTDPKNDCATEPVAGCEQDGFCGPAGACRFYAQGEKCGETTCQNGVQAGHLCNGVGTCVDGQHKSCGYFLCGTDACKTSCSTSADCTSDAWCNQSVCEKKQDNGAACADAGACKSGHCSDQVCCNQACQGICEACAEPNSAGICVPVPGDPRANHGDCSGPTGDDVCSARACDGINPDSCDGYVRDVKCREESCSEATHAFEATCNGAGQCRQLVSEPCEPYACDGTKCRTSCTKDDDCVLDLSCQAGECTKLPKCDQDQTVTLPNGGVIQCAPYKCNADGSCKTDCKGAGDCASGYVCSGTGACAEPAPPRETSEQDGGCGCRSAGRKGTPGTLAGIFALAGAMLLYSRRRGQRAALAATLTLLLMGCSSRDSAGGADKPAPVEPAGDTPATRLIAGLRARFPEVSSFDKCIEAPVFAQRPEQIAVQWSGKAAAQVTLPLRADAAVRVVDDASGMALAFTVEETFPVEANVAPGYVVYRAALSGADLIQRPTRFGTEDLVFLSRAPARESLSYRVDVSRAAGLRLVGDVLELLDAGGSPRLRINAPFTVDARAVRRRARLELDPPCNADRSPAPPWGRPVTAAGSSICRVRVLWGKAIDQELEYPLLIDPVWESTGKMLAPRVDAAGALVGGLVLVVGGFDLAAYDSAELYNPTANNWTTTAPPKVARRGGHTATTLGSGTQVLIAGGKATSGTLASTEIYDLTGGSFNLSANMTVARQGHTATFLVDEAPSRAVMIVGGSNSSGVLSTSEVFDATAGTFGSTLSFKQARSLHAALLHPDGRLQIAGGVYAQGPPATYINSYEMYRPPNFNGTGEPAQWLSPIFETDPPNPFPVGMVLSEARARLTLVQLVDKNVLYIGGENASGPLSTVDIRSPKGGTLLTPVAQLPEKRSLHGTALLSNGRVLVAGGEGTTGGLLTAYLYDATVNIWIPTADLSPPSSRHVTLPLGGDRVLFAGGAGSSPDVSTSAVVFRLLGNGETCQQGSECVSRHCVDGVCCGTACNAPCQACSAAAKGGGSDGTCGPAKVDTDPHEDCVSAPPCGTTGVCNGQGACAKESSGTQCDESSCQSGKLTVKQCNGDGLCASVETSCAPFSCGTPAACASSCQLDSDCAAGAACHAGSCVVKLELGAPCPADNVCKSGFCVDGVCCDSSCTGACRACTQSSKGTGVDGVCGFAAAGTDPHEDCSDLGPSKCLSNGKCDGSGACQNYAVGTACGATACVGNDQTGFSCKAAALCEGKTVVSCGLYRCTEGACPTACATHGECVDSAWCNSGACVDKKPAGSACQIKEECSDGFCADGVCCNLPCTGPCESCKEPKNEGSCIPVTSPRQGHPQCSKGDAGEPCTARVCDGTVRDSCAGYVGQGVSCAPSRCEDGHETPLAFCDGQGHCPSPAKIQCGLYECGQNACLKSCTSHAECSLGATCDLAKKECVPGASCDGHTFVGLEGKPVDCSPYTCEATGCRTSCVGPDECVAPAVCSPERKCTKPNPAAEAGGCGCRTVNHQRERDRAWLALLAAVLALGVRRRRRARARSISD